jgi:hypothetical protein
MNHKLSDQALEHMQEAFADLCLSDHFHQHAYSGEEHDEPQFSHLARLAFTFNARDHGRLRELVDYINLPENLAQSQPPAQPRSRQPSRFTKAKKHGPLSK